jgi:hypothetical protein
MLYLTIILIAFNIVNVFIDAYKITVLKKWIRHSVNFSLYLTCYVSCLFIFKLHSPLEIMLSAVASFLNRQITFDIPLNLKRGLDWFYVTKERVISKIAFLDRMEIRVFGYNGKAPVYVYSFLWIIISIIHYTIFD